MCLARAGLQPVPCAYAAHAQGRRPSPPGRSPSPALAPRIRKRGTRTPRAWTANLRARRVCSGDGLLPGTDKPQRARMTQPRWGRASTRCLRFASEAYGPSAAVVLRPRSGRRAYHSPDTWRRRSSRKLNPRVGPSDSRMEAPGPRSGSSASSPRLSGPRPGRREPRSGWQGPRFPRQGRRFAARCPVSLRQGLLPLSQKPGPLRQEPRTLT